MMKSCVASSRTSTSRKLAFEQKEKPQPVTWLRFDILDFDDYSAFGNAVLPA